MKQPSLWSFESRAFPSHKIPLSFWRHFALQQRSWFPPNSPPLSLSLISLSHPILNFPLTLSLSLSLYLRSFLSFCCCSEQRKSRAVSRLLAFVYLYGWAAVASATSALASTTTTLSAATPNTFRHLRAKKLVSPHFYNFHASKLFPFWRRAKANPTTTTATIDAFASVVVGVVVGFFVFTCLGETVVGPSTSGCREVKVVSHI